MSARLTRAALYGAQVFLSFFLMLVFMTYNVRLLSSLYSLSYSMFIVQAYLIAATVLGAAIGHFIFSSHMDIDAVLSGGAADKGMACH